jgi:hypothetical protein
VSPLLWPHWSPVSDWIIRPFNHAIAEIECRDTINTRCCFEKHHHCPGWWARWESFYKWLLSVCQRDFVRPASDWMMLTKRWCCRQPIVTKMKCSICLDREDNVLGSDYPVISLPYSDLMLRVRYWFD